MVDYREIIRLKSIKPEMNNTMIASSGDSSRNTVFEVWKPLGKGDVMDGHGCPYQPVFGTDPVA